jgi:chemotaxis protein methyltransferase CheR
MINFKDLDEAKTLAQAIVNTISEPFIVLDDRFTVLAASVSFYDTFKVDPESTRDRPLFLLGGGRWDIPELRVFLQEIISKHTPMEGFDIEHDLPGLGRRTMRLNARQVIYADSARTTILLAFKDVTERQTIEKEKEDLHRSTEALLREKNILLQEMEHRVANSLQIIASILMMKAKAVSSSEARQNLRDAHQRVMSVAEVQRHLHATDGVDQIDVGPYLSTLCVSLASSMIGDSQPIAVNVMADIGHIGSHQAVSLGLIVTELVINAVKYAFPTSKVGATIQVSYEIFGTEWKLIVADNGVGKPDGVKSGSGGLGTAIVQSLVKQLDAVIETTSDPNGVSVSVESKRSNAHTSCGIDGVLQGRRSMPKAQANLSVR